MSRLPRSGELPPGDSGPTALGRGIEGLRVARFWGVRCLLPRFCFDMGRA
ncbi:hypothetical protein [Streptomyces sp. NPDC003710]